MKFGFKVAVHSGLWEKAPSCDPLKTTWAKQETDSDAVAWDDIQHAPEQADPMNGAAGVPSYKICFKEGYCI